MPQNYFQEFDFQEFEGKISYYNLSKLSAKNFRKNIEIAISNKHQALIIDLRAYPADDYLEVIADLLLEKTIPYAYWSVPNLTQPGTFNFTQSDIIGKDNTNAYKGKIIVLCSGWTMSYGETLCSIFKNMTNAKFIGQKTAGANGNVTKIYLPGNYMVQYSGLGAYFASGQTMQMNSVPITKEITPTIEGIRQGRDEILEKAIDIIKNEKF